MKPSDDQWARALEQIKDHMSDVPATDDDHFDGFTDWYEYGFDRGWIGPSICLTHDGEPLTEAEDESMYEGNDPCVYILRLYESRQTKLDVEAHHPPSVWRRTNQLDHGQN